MAKKIKVETRGRKPTQDPTHGDKFTNLNPTPKQLYIIAEHYFFNNNSQNALIAAGYSEITAKKHGAKLIREHPKIQKIQIDLHNQMMKTMAGKATSMLSNIIEVAQNTNLRNYFTDWGKMKDFNQITDVQFAGIKKISIRETEKVVEGAILPDKRIEIELHNPLDAFKFAIDKLTTTYKENKADETKANEVPQPRLLEPGEASVKIILEDYSDKTLISEAIVIE